MSPSHAAELVTQHKGDCKIKMFELLNIQGKDQLEAFARDCGFLIASNVRRINEKFHEH